MLGIIGKYTHWLHAQWPAGKVEKGPEVNEDGTTAVPGVRVVGDLTGVPLLKFSADTGARAIEAFLKEPDFKPSKDSSNPILDVAIIGAGVSGISAAIEAKKAGLNYCLYESQDAFSTIKNFPRKKPIFTYPTDMVPAGEMRFNSEIKEDLLDELDAQKTQHAIETTPKHVEKLSRQDGMIQLHLRKEEPVRAKRVIVAIGRTGNYRKLNVPGENLDKVSNRLHDPKEYGGQNILVVGGGDSALEAAIAMAESGAQVTLSYRKKEFSRPKPDNVDKLKQLQEAGSLTLRMGTNVQDISEKEVTLCEGKEDEVFPNDYVFIMIGREPPLDFFRKSGIPVTGDWSPKVITTLVAFFTFCIFMYHWKSGGNIINSVFQKNQWFPFNLSGGDPTTLWGTLKIATKDPGFYYSFAYCSCVVAFGFRRIKRRKTPYVKVQTFTLMAFQCIPLFFLPYIIFPWMGANGAFTGGGIGQWFGDTFFPGGSYWRSFGFILAWPLFIWNVFTEQPVWGWLALSFIQTFVIIPLIVWRWGKGAYCGWVCSCGALAETLGDTHRHKMPHGPFWNKLNMVGQVVLWSAMFLLVLRIGGWIFPDTKFGWLFNGLVAKFPIGNYKYIVDLWLAGVIGVGFYFHLSGRVWCRFACPLAALMHIYARFSQFRIFTQKKKCISCNVCTSVCHQGIDIMNFANKGLPMQDPECVRCSACVQSCPTGVLTFGRYDGQGEIVYDKIPASPVNMREAASPVDQYLANNKA